MLYYIYCKSNLSAADNQLVNVFEAKQIIARNKRLDAYENYPGLFRYWVEPVK